MRNKIINHLLFILLANIINFLSILFWDKVLLHNFGGKDILVFIIFSAAILNISLLFSLLLSSINRVIYWYSLILLITAINIFIEWHMIVLTIQLISLGLSFLIFRRCQISML